MKTIELRPAFVWNCPECDEDNFVKAIFIEGIPDELQKEMEFNKDRKGHFVESPDEVTCLYCEESHKTESFGSTKC